MTSVRFPRLNIPAPNFSLPEDSADTYAKFAKVVDDGSIAAAGLLLGEANRTRYTEPAPTKFKVGDRVLVSTWRAGESGTVEKITDNEMYKVRFADHDTYRFFDYQLRIDDPAPTPRPVQAGDKVRVKETSPWRLQGNLNPVVASDVLVIESTVGTKTFSKYPGLHTVRARSEERTYPDLHFRPSDLELVTAAEEVAPVSWRGVPFDRVDYTRALKIDHGTSHSFAPNQRIRIKRSDKMEAFHGVEGSVVSVDPDGTYHCQLDGDSYTRETYRFRENELEAVVTKVAAAKKEMRRNPVPKFAPLVACASMSKVETVALGLFRSDARVAAFINMVSDHALNARDLGHITVFDDQDQDRVERALRVAWARDENGWRTECELKAEAVLLETKR